MNAFQLLKNDHKIVSDLFDKIESSSGRAKTQLFTRLKSELDVHASVEEKIFYPALENKQESREITLEAYEEHKVVKDLLAELANGKSADEEWDAKLKVLRENVDHHVEEEEGELFDKADDVLSDEDIERLGNEMEAEKARQQGLTPPRRTTSRGKKKSAGSRKQADSPGVLKRLANLVGLGSGSSKGSSKASSKSASKGRKKKAAKKTSGKRAARKSGVTKAGKASKSAASGKSASRKGSGSKSGSKKSTKRSGVSKRKSGGSKKR